MPSLEREERSEEDERDGLRCRYHRPSAAAGTTAAVSLTLTPSRFSNRSATD